MFVDCFGGSPRPLTREVIGSGGALAASDSQGDCSGGNLAAAASRGDCVSDCFLMCFHLLLIVC